MTQLQQWIRDQVAAFTPGRRVYLGTWITEARHGNRECTVVRTDYNLILVRFADGREKWFAFGDLSVTP